MQAHALRNNPLIAIISSSGGAHAAVYGRNGDQSSSPKSSSLVRYGGFVSIPEVLQAGRCSLSLDSCPLTIPRFSALHLRTMPQDPLLRPTVQDLKLRSPRSPQCSWDVFSMLSVHRAQNNTHHPSSILFHTRLPTQVSSGTIPHRQMETRAALNPSRIFCRVS